jgi:anthranilate phosphoribosyltransferase
VARNLNPAGSPASIMGIFHPGYDVTHQGAAQLLQDKNMAVFKGEGGESERNPDADCLVKLLIDGVMSEEIWPALFSTRHMKDEAMDISRLGKLWRGDIEDEYGQGAVVATAAVALRAMGRAANIAEAERQAADLWQQRNREFFPGA